MTVPANPPNNFSAELLARDMSDAYGAAAASWAVGAQVVYGRLAEALVATAMPDEVATRSGQELAPVLDLCAGTGAASEPLRRHGYNVVAVDFALGMLRVDHAMRPPAVVGDAVALPFHNGSFAATVVACGLNHAVDPVAFLAEAGRVTQPDGIIATSTFAHGWDHPAKIAVDNALRPYGFVTPSWHRSLKHNVEPATSDPVALTTIAAQAGLRSSIVTNVIVNVAATAAETVGWRFAMASHAGFVSRMTPTDYRAAEMAAVDEVRRRWEPLEIPLLVLSCVV